MSWELLWKIFLIITLVSYTILVIVVSIGGVKNIKDMFKDLNEQAKENQAASKSPKLKGEK